MLLSPEVVTEDLGSLKEGPWRKTPPPLLDAVEDHLVMMAMAVVMANLEALVDHKAGYLREGDRNLDGWL